MHEEKHISKVFEFAFLLSTELTNSDLTAEACSEIILQKYTVWLDEMNRAPAQEAERLEQAEARKQAAAERRTKEAHAISNQIANLRQDRWLFGLGFSILTFILTYHFLT